MASRAGLHIPPAELGLRLVDRNEWIKVWMRVRATTAVKSVGYAACEFADYDTGDNCRPGCTLLAAVCGEQMTERTAMKALAQIREWGLLWRYVEGSRNGRRGVADEYRLTIPGNLLARVPMLTPDYKTPDQVTSGQVIEADHVTSEHLITAGDASSGHLIPVDNPPDHVTSDQVISEHVISEHGTPDLRVRNRCPQDTPPFQDLFIDPFNSEAEGLDFAPVENSAAGAEVKNGISFTSSRDDVEAERRRQADALTAWEAGQRPARSA